MKIVNNRNSNITYYIDEEKRTIVAKLSNCKFDVINALNRIVNDHDSYSIQKLLLRDKYISKAVCHEEDTWDEEKGMRIALASVLQKYHRDKQHALQYFLDCLDVLKGAVQIKADLSGVKSFEYEKEYMELTKE